MAEDLYYRFTRKEYDSVRLLESVTDYNGLGIRFEYTKEGLLHSITDSAGRRLRVEQTRGTDASLRYTARIRKIRRKRLPSPPTSTTPTAT